MRVKPKYWAGLVLAIAIAAASKAQANPYSTELAALYKDEPVSAHAICAAFNGLVAVKQEGMVQQIIMQEAQRHAGKVRTVYGSQGVDFIEQLMHDVKSSYNSGKLTWDNMVSTAEACMGIGS